MNRSRWGWARAGPGDGEGAGRRPPPRLAVDALLPPEVADGRRGGSPAAAAHAAGGRPGRGRGGRSRAWWRPVGLAAPPSANQLFWSARGAEPRPSHADGLLRGALPEVVHAPRARPGPESSPQQGPVVLFAVQLLEYALSVLPRGRQGFLYAHVSRRSAEEYRTAWLGVWTSSPRTSTAYAPLSPVVSAVLRVSRTMETLSGTARRLVRVWQA